MIRNLGKLDRLIRVTIAVFLILMILSNSILGIWAIVSGILAIVLLATAIYGTCPLYSLLKLSSLKK
jgi:hypothetical protein